MNHTIFEYGSDSIIDGRVFIYALLVVLLSFALSFQRSRFYLLWLPRKTIGVCADFITRLFTGRNRQEVYRSVDRFERVLSFAERILSAGVAILGAPKALISRFVYGTRSSLIWARRNPAKLMLCFGAGVTAGILAARRLRAKWQKENPEIIKVLDNPKVILESKNFTITPLLDIVRRVILFIMAYTCLAGSLFGLLDNRVVKDVGYLFLSIFRLVQLGPKHDLCLPTQPCCPFRNNTLAVIRPIIECSCDCHSHPVLTNGTPCSFDGANRHRADLENKYLNDSSYRKDVHDNLLNIHKMRSEALDKARAAKAEWDKQAPGERTLVPPTPKEPFIAPSRKGKEVDGGTTLVSEDEEINAPIAEISKETLVVELLKDTDLLDKKERTFIKRILGVWTRLKLALISWLVSISETIGSVAFFKVFVFMTAAIITALIYLFYRWIKRWWKNRKEEQEVKRMIVDHINTVLFAAVPEEEVPLESKYRRGKKKNKKGTQEYGPTGDAVNFQIDDDDFKAEFGKSSKEMAEDRRQDQEEYERMYGTRGSIYIDTPKDRARNARYRESAYYDPGEANLEILPHSSVAEPERELDSENAPLVCLESKGKAIVVFTCPLCNQRGHPVSRCPSNPLNGHVKRWQYISKRFANPIAAAKVGELPSFYELEHGWVFDNTKIRPNPNTKSLQLIGSEAPVAGIPIINVSHLGEYTVPLYIDGRYCHCAIPIGNYLIGPYHGHNEKLSYRIFENGAEVFKPLEVVHLKENVPSLFAADDIIIYRKPNSYRSVALSKEEPKPGDDVYIVGFYEGTLVMSGPTPLKDVLASEGTQQFKTLTHINSSRVGMSGAALVSAATSKVVGIHLGCRGEVGVNFGCVLSGSEKIATVITTPPQKTKGEQLNAVAVALNSV